MRPLTRQQSAPNAFFHASLRRAHNRNAPDQTAQATQDHSVPQAEDESSSVVCLEDDIARIEGELSRIANKTDALNHKIESFTSVEDSICCSDEMQRVMDLFSLGELRRDRGFLLLITARVIDSAWLRPNELARQADRCIQAAIGLPEGSDDDKEDFWAGLSKQLSQLPVISALSLLGVMETYKVHIPASEQATFNKAKDKLVARAQNEGFDVKV